MNYKKFIVSGFTALSLLVGGIAQAQTDASSTPGAPNTGAGGDAAQNVLLLVTSGLVAIAGAGYLLRTRKTQTH